MSAITVAPRIRCKRPVAAKKNLRRIGDGVFRTIVEMAYEMGSCEWRDNMKEHLTPLFRSVMDYADKPKPITGKMPPLRRQPNWIASEFSSKRYLDKTILAKHKYTSVSLDGQLYHMVVTIHRTFQVHDRRLYAFPEAHKVRHDGMEYTVSTYMYYMDITNRGDYERVVYFSECSLDDAINGLYKLPRCYLALSY